MVKEMEEMSEEGYQRVKDSGMMFEFFPCATGNFKIDVLGKSIRELLNEVEE